METMTIKMFDYPYEIYEYNAAEYVESLENLSQALEKPFLFANIMSVDNLTYDNSPRHKTLR